MGTRDRQRLFWPLVIFCCVGLVALRGPDAAGKPTRAEARRLHQEGMQLYEKKSFIEAAKRFTLAYEAMPSAELLYNIARAWQEGGLIPRARQRYEELMVHPKAPPELRKKALAYLRELDAQAPPSEPGDPDEPGGRGPNRPDAPPPPEPAITQRAAEVEAAFRLFNAARFDELASRYAPEAVLRAVGTPAPPVRGPEALRAAFTQSRHVFPDGVILPSRIVVLPPDLVVVQSAFVGTHRGDFYGRSATKRRVGYERLSVIRAGPDGLVAEQWDYGDAVVTPLLQIGALVGPPVPRLPAAPVGVEVAGGAADARALQAVRAFYAAWAGGDDTALAQAASPELTLYDLTRGEVHQGLDASRSELTSWREAISGMAVLLEGPRASSTLAVARFRLQGTHGGTLGAVPATGRPVALSLCDLLALRGGRIVRIERYWSAHELMTQLAVSVVP